MATTDQHSSRSRSQAHSHRGRNRSHSTGHYNTRHTFDGRNNSWQNSSQNFYPSNKGGRSKPFSNNRVNFDNSGNFNSFASRDSRQDSDNRQTNGKFSKGNRGRSQVNRISFNLPSQFAIDNGNSVSDTTEVNNSNDTHVKSIVNRVVTSQVDNYDKVNFCGLHLNGVDKEKCKRPYLKLVW